MTRIRGEELTYSSSRSPACPIFRSCTDAPLLLMYRSCSHSFPFQSSQIRCLSHSLPRHNVKTRETAIVGNNVVHVPGTCHVASYLDVPAVAHVMNGLTTFHILKHRNFFTRSTLYRSKNGTRVHGSYDPECVPTAYLPYTFWLNNRYRRLR